MKYLGVASWRGWKLTYSDGMCTDCAARARAEWSLPAQAPPPAPAPRRRRRPDLALAAGVLLLLLSAGLGVLVGPPPRTVSQPVRTGASLARRDGMGPAVVPEAAPLASPYTARRAAPPGPDTAVAAAPGAGVSARGRVRPAAARVRHPRPVRAVHGPFLPPARDAGEVTPAVAGPAAPELSLLDRVPVQAP